MCYCLFSHMYENISKIFYYWKIKLLISKYNIIILHIDQLILHVKIFIWSYLHYSVVVFFNKLIVPIIRDLTADISEWCWILSVWEGRILMKSQTPPNDIAIVISVWWWELLWSCQNLSLSFFFFFFLLSDFPQKV